MATETDEQSARSDTATETESSPQDPGIEKETSGSSSRSRFSRVGDGVGNNIGDGVHRSFLSRIGTIISDIFRRDSTGTIGGRNYGRQVGQAIGNGLARIPMRLFLLLALIPALADTGSARTAASRMVGKSWQVIRGFRRCTALHVPPKLRSTVPDSKGILMHRIGIRAVVVTAVALVLGGLSVSVPAEGAARTCMGKTATIVGTGGVDTINGTAGADVIVGLAGADIIRGLGGKDTICGGAGADQIRGGARSDRIAGGVGADMIRGGPGSDLLKGGIGADVIRGGPGADRIRGGPGSDTCFSPKHAPGCEF